MSASSAIKSFAKKQFVTEDVLWKSEKEANRTLMISMVLLAAVIGICWAANKYFNVFALEQNTFDQTFFKCTPMLLIPCVIAIAFKNDKPWIKYLLMFQYVFVIALMSSILTYTVELCIVFPLVVSTRYYNRPFTIQTILLTLLMFGIFTQLSPTIGMLNLNNVNNAMAHVNTIHLNGQRFADVVGTLVDLEEYKKSYLRYHYLPNVILYSMVAMICVAVAKRGKEMVVEQREIVNKSSRIESELSLATDIQANLLPTIFPPFPERKDVDIFASMTPAKEVGGDFYDYFLIDEDHLGLVIGDVSGKGVPAALFMVTAKTLIKDHACMGIDAGRVYTEVNDLLCEGNDAGLFVTSFMAIINLKTGRVFTVNAGHNPPMVRRGSTVQDGLPGSNCEFEYLHTKPGFVLAGLEGVKYKATTFNMYPGDTIFLYTDGVTEATDANNELYGEDRLKVCLNSKQWKNTEEMIEAVKVDVNKFVDVAPQFDDITMLAFTYLGPEGLGTGSNNSITVTTTTEHVNYVTEFVEGIMSKYNAPMTDVAKINIAIDEIYSNIAKFAYIDEKTGEPRVGQATLNVIPVEEGDKVAGLTIEFVDSGTPYNPLTQEDPLTNLPAEERDIGGLGIFIVKKQMDDVSYRYEDHHNILSITKMFTKEEDLKKKDK